MVQCESVKDGNKKPHFIATTSQHSQRRQIKMYQSGIHISLNE